MKRVVVITLPILSAFIAIGLGLFLFRTQIAALGPRLTAAREAATEVLEEVAEEAVEEIQEATR